MALIITLNPSIDRRYLLDSFSIGDIRRTEKYEATAGGKGINVSRVGKELGLDGMAIGFLGGHGGAFIKEELNKLCIKNEFTKISGETRTCIAILSPNEQTEILESGPSIMKEELQQFEEDFLRLVEDHSVIVASGSLPRGVPTSMYGKLISRCNDLNKRFILDTSGSALEEGLKASPYMVKPNVDELLGLIGFETDNLDEIIDAVNQLRESYNIPYFIVSLGEEGALLVGENGAYQTTLPKVEVRNPVGSGDSMVAGLTYGLENHYSDEDLLRFASACGTANAMEEQTAKVSRENTETLMKHIEVKKIR
jgi:tagatose 6-phosphate kinase